MDIWLINHYAVPPKYYPLARQTYFARHLMAMGHTVTIFAASTVHNADQNLITDGSPWREEVVDGLSLERPDGTRCLNGRTSRWKAEEAALLCEKEGL